MSIKLFFLLSKDTVNCCIAIVFGKVFGFFEELLSTRFPFSSYKLVFVDQAYSDTASYSTLTICR